MITKMTKYSFILLSDEAGKFLEKLQEMGVVDITRSGKPVDVRSSAMLEKAMETKKAAALLGKTDYGKDPDCEAILKASEEAALAVTNQVVDVSSIPAMLLSVLYIGVLTGLGEEMFFREETLSGGG